MNDQTFIVAYGLKHIRTYYVLIILQFTVLLSRVLSRLFALRIGCGIKCDVTQLDVVGIRVFRCNLSTQFLTWKRRFEIYTTRSKSMAIPILQSYNR